MTVLAPMCMGCRHYRPDDALFACDAYPTGIPEGIVRSQVDHRQPAPGDNGIRFDPVTAADAGYAVDLFGARVFNVDLGAYSPTQPRRSDGKFGTKGGGGGGAAGTPGDTEDGKWGANKLRTNKDALVHEERDRQGENGGVPLNVSSHVSSQLKHEAMVAVGDDLDAQFSPERLKALADQLPASSGPVLSETPGRQVADGVMATWAETAFDTRAPASVAIQEAARMEFKTGTSPYIKQVIAEGPIPDFDGKAAKQYDAPVLRAALRSMHTHTQQRLDDLGVAATVTLHRGVGRDYRGETDVDFNPASSWSTQKSTARTFAVEAADKRVAVGTYSDGGTVFTMTVPRERILSMAGSGMGSFEEGEVVVVRGSGDRAFGEVQG